jgi:hypothetical protein
MPGGVIKDSQSSRDGFSVCALEVLANMSMLATETQILTDRVILDFARFADFPDESVAGFRRS